MGQLRLANIATLDAIATHFARLIELTSADEDYINALCTTLAPCVLRPKQESSLTMAEKFNFRLVRDLFEHKEAIFGELKRSAAAQKERESAGAETRPRAISTDESNRRQHVEERNRAIIANRSRASSPAPGARVPSGPGGPTVGHRRDRSIGGPETRFPVAPSGVTGSPTERRAHARQSLEVPDGSESPVPAEKREANGAAEAPAADGLVKRDSLGTGKLPRKAPGAGRASVGTEDRPVGVELVDRPMDD